MGSQHEKELMKSLTTKHHSVKQDLHLDRTEGGDHVGTVTSSLELLCDDCDVITPAKLTPRQDGGRRSRGDSDVIIRATV